MADRKQLRMERAGGPLFAPTGRVGGGPFVFGEDDPRIELFCIDCNTLLDTVPPDFEFRGPRLGEIVWVCACGTHNVGPLGEA